VGGTTFLADARAVASRMPPRGTATVDPLAVARLGTWITGMTSCP